MKGQPQGCIVLVKWVDSTIPHKGWQMHSEAIANRKNDMACWSTGWLLADDKIGVSLASSIHAGEVSGVVHIPRGAIKDLRIIRKARS